MSLDPPKESLTAPGLSVSLPALEDAASMHRLASECGLDVNSEFSYLMVCHYFKETSAIATHQGEVSGFVSGFLVPDSPTELFIWQIAVSPEARGRGIASRMLDSLIERLRDRGVNYLQATINPSNDASKNAFCSLAGRLGAEVSHSVVFNSDHFGDRRHEDEILYRIGPFTPGDDRAIS